MEDRNQEIFRQYHMKIYNTYRIRGAFILETDKGLKLLKSLESSKNRVEFEDAILEHLGKVQYSSVDMYVRNIAGEIITEDGMGNKYAVKNWYQGEECNLREEGDVSDAAAHLAFLHSMLREVDLTQEQIEHNTYPNMVEVFEKRNRELKRVRSYIKEKRKKNEFELCYLNCYDEFYQQALEATQMLKNSNYLELIKDAIEHRCICHGNYTYHNIIMLKPTSGIYNLKEQEEFLSAAGIQNRRNTNIATTNFDKAYVGVQIMDLYHYMRKVMEKNDWNIEFGSIILDTYTNILNVDKEERKLLYLLLLYPEKFWKITNFYYNSKKSWVPQRNVQKLVGIGEQTERRKQFMNLLASTIEL